MKFRTLTKRLLSLLLLVSLLMSLIPASIAAQADAADVFDLGDDSVLSILAIGNWEDTLAYVYEIATDLGISHVFLGNLCAGDDSLAIHWANAKDNRPSYTYYTNDNGTWHASEGYTMSTALSCRSWDYICLQQAHGSSGVESTYNTDLTNLVSYVKTKSPDAKLVWNMTWAYEEGSSKFSETIYADQLDMHHNTVSAVINKISNNKDFAKIIPLSSAVQNIRTSLAGQSVCAEDGYRLSKDLGRYLAGLTLVQTITGLDIWQCTWAPEDIPYAWQVIAMESVTNGILHPFAITTSQHTDPETSYLYELGNTRSESDPYNDSNYARLLPYWTKGGFWQSNHASSPTSIIKNSSESPQFWCTRRYEPDTLPIGSVIILASGYKYRPEAWKSDATQSSRPKEVTTAGYTVVDSTWWGSYTKRAFNISNSKETDISDLSESAINGAFKLYYPVSKAQGSLTDVTKFVRLRITLTKSAYWYCTHDSRWNEKITNEDNSKNFFCTAQFTKSQLPVGSVVYCHASWKLRPEYWNGNNKWTRDRPHMMNEVYLRIGNAQYLNATKIAFNVTLNTPASLANYTDTQLQNAFKIYIPASKHSHNYSVTTVDSTCSAAGTTTYDCKTCYHSYTDTIAKKPHTLTPIAAIAPTCTATGLTEGARCTVCSAVTTAQSVVPALGHSYDITDNSNGTHSRICFCGNTIMEQHSFVDSICICGAEKVTGLLEPDPIDVVIDFAKPVVVDVRNRATISAVTEEMLAKAPMRAELADSAHAAYGDWIVFDSDNDGLDDSLRFIPKAFLPGIITVNCIFTVYFETVDIESDVIVPVRIIPATTVYYETDFSDTAVSLNTVGSQEDKHQWILDSTAEAVQDQDHSVIGQHVYDFTFDKEHIPSNAFFADFTGQTEHYTKDPTYAGVNYSLESNWCYNSSRTTAPAIDTKAGTMTLSTIEPNTHAYVQSGGDLQKYFNLNYHPENDHYMEIRFKLENFILAGTAAPNLTFAYYIGTDYKEGTDTEKAYTACSKPFAADALNSGEYITIRSKITLPNDNHTKMTAIRFTLNNVKSTDASHLGKWTIDYIYVGPMADEGSNKGLDHEYQPSTKYGAAQYLLFDFENSAMAQSRYNHSNYGNRQFDNASSLKWAVWTGGTSKTITLNNNIGTIKLPVYQALDNGKSAYGSYLSTTATAGTFPWTTTDASHHSLNYTPSGSTYFHIRFKTTGCKKDDVQNKTQSAQLEINLMNSNRALKGKTENILNYKDGEYLEVSSDISVIAGQTGTIKTFYIRFRNIMSQSASTPGYVEVDYIYIGPEPDADKIRPTEEKSVLIHFDNTAYDQQRYTGEHYGAINLDVAAGWNNTWWFSYNLTANPGILKLTPTTNYAGWGQIEANTADRDAMMNYKLTGKDYAVVRMKVNSAVADQSTSGGTPTFEFQFGSTAKSGLVGETAGVEVYSVSHVVDLSKNGQWVTYYFDLSSYASLITRISFFRLIWDNILFNSGGSVQIDYVYIGPLNESYGPADSLYMGFDNHTSDQIRYSGVTYGGVNFDNPRLNSWTYDAPTMTGYEIDNQNGTMVLKMKSDIGEAYPDAHIDTYSEAQGQYPLNFLPDKAEVFQIRFKLENTCRADNPYVDLQAWGYVDNTLTSVRSESVFFTKEVLGDINGQYYTITIPLTGVFGNLTKVNRIRPYFGKIASMEGDSGRIIIDYIYIGPGDTVPSDEMTYGYDSTYNDDTGNSNGRSYFVEGLGLPLLSEDQTINFTGVTTYTEASFTFMGTGFDIISRTGPNQGNIRVFVCDRYGIVKKSVTVFLKDNQDLFQIPIVSVNGLEHDTYTVHIFVNSAFTYPDPDPKYEFLNRGNEFYFDAVRIYDTINTQADTPEAEAAYEVYLHHGEADPIFKELHDILIEAGNFNAGGSLDGVVFLTATPKDGENYNDPTGKMELEVAEYKAIGPNNEVYLDTGNAIVFKMVVEGMIPASIDIGARSIGYRSNAASMVVNVSTNPPDDVPTGTAQIISTYTTLYYPLEIPSSAWQVSEDNTENHYVYVTIYNNGSTSDVLSITDIKYAYDVPKAATMGKPRAVHFMVDREMAEQFTDSCVHKWNEGAVTLQPTCTQNGQRVYTCESCGDTRTEEVERLDHSYNKGEITTAPTCTAGGVKTFTCGMCSDTYTEAVPAKGHSFANGSCTACGTEDPNYVLSNPFVDVKESDYFYTPVLWAVQKGITTGTSATTFAPNSPCTRGQIVTFLWRAAGSPEPTTTANPFSDIREKDYFYKAVLWAVEEGITTGTGKGKFSPNDSCTRAQVATFLWRSQGKPMVTSAQNIFSDVPEETYYYNAVLWAVENGITNGTGKGKFSPEDSCTRGQIVTFLYRALS